MIKILKLWILVSFVCFVLSGTIYLVAQQIYRQGANDPQNVTTEEIQKQVFDGKDPKTLVPKEQVDLRSSLSPFVQVYDANLNLVAGNAYIDNTNNIPKVPEGVLKAAMPGDDVTVNMVTWQPENGVRSAIVARWATDKFVIVSGRNLLDVERRESNLNLQVGLGLVAAIGGSLFVILILERLLPEKRK